MQERCVGGWSGWAARDLLALPSYKIHAAPRGPWLVFPFYPARLGKQL